MAASANAIATARQHGMNSLDPVERRKEQNRNAQRKYRKRQKETALVAGAELLHSISSTETKRSKTSQPQIQHEPSSSTTTSTTTSPKQYDHHHLAHMLHHENHHDPINDDLLVAPELEIWKASQAGGGHHCMLDEDQLLDKSFNFATFNTSAVIIPEAYPPVSSSESRSDPDPDPDQDQEREQEPSLDYPSTPPPQKTNDRSDGNSASSQYLLAHGSAPQVQRNHEMYAASDAGVFPSPDSSSINETSSGSTYQSPRAQAPLAGAKQVEEGTALHLAALHGQTSAVKMLLNRGAHHSLQNRHGERPLHLAVHARHILIVRLLLAHGADINARGGAGGGTALHLAVNNQDQSMVTLLIGSAGIDIDARDGLNRTPLHVAVEKGYASILGMLRKANADIDARRDDGLTALHHAIVGDRAEIVSMLLDHGANQEAESVLMGGPAA